MYSHQSTCFQVLKIRLNSYTDCYIYINKDAHYDFKSLSPPQNECPFLEKTLSGHSTQVCIEPLLVKTINVCRMTALRRKIICFEL